MNKLKKSEVWQERIDNMAIKIIKSSPYDNTFGSQWFYYIFLHEAYCKNFEELWFPNIIKDEYCTNNYSLSDIFDKLEFHGGISCYRKHGHSKGFRTVEFGCDFQHLWDEGNIYTLEEVYGKAVNSANLARNLFYKEKK